VRQHSDYIHRRINTDTQMPSKTISLQEETYARLERAKGEDESFSDVIDRLLGEERHPIYGLVGLLDEEDVERVRERSPAFREDVETRLDADAEEP
jgi:predicted CopG family antitoxin